MRKYNVAFGENRKAKKWNNGTITWDELRERLRTPLRTAETQEEYHHMKSAGRSAAKDKGGFVAGTLRDGLRRAANVESRSMLTLDVDNASKTFLEEYETLSPYQTFIYSTHSHTPEVPRLRLVIPLTRDINADEYQAITRLFASEHGINQFDLCSFIPSQLMFWPTASRDGEYVFVEVEGKPLDPDLFLTRYPSWKDPTSLPTTIKERPLHEKAGSKVEDPLTKKGIVGTFCRTFSISEAIEKFLSDIYEPAGENRYHLIGSVSGPGLIIFNDKFAYSNHATDPAYHQECNAFDLVKVHKFPDEEEKRSFKAMSEWATSQPEVAKALLSERQEAAKEDFSISDEGDDTWKASLTLDRNGNVQNTLHNLGLIIQNDPYLQSIVFNELADCMEIKGEVPWRRDTNKLWRDADDAQLIWYVDQNYGVFSSRNYEVAVTKIADDRSYHPIKDYLESLPEWDGVKRAETLLIDYLGAADNEYVRAVTRKTLCAAVKRIYEPGTKFDNMLVLNGPQGIGKSTIISKLAMEWFSDSLSLSDMNDGKTAPEKLQGYWLQEIGEMAGMKKADIDKVKSFVSRNDDKYRPAFGRRVTPHPRQCVFFGTTNAENGFLRDVTGNRRYWVVTTPGSEEKHPWDLEQKDVDQIWAEVLVLVKQGEQLTLPVMLDETAKQVQAEAMESDEREGLIRLYLSTKLPSNWNDMDLYSRREYLRGEDPSMREGTVERTQVSNMEIWCECFGQPRETLRNNETYAIRAMMSRIEGWERTGQLVKMKLYGPQRVYRKK